jgi:hypothetical protein
MQRILTYHIDDLAVDHKDVMATVNAACTHRGVEYTVRGVCQVEDHVYFILLPLEDKEREEEYVLVPKADPPSRDEMIAILNDRWNNNFDPVGSIQVYETPMILYAKPLVR